MSPYILKKLHPKVHNCIHSSSLPICSETVYAVHKFTLFSTPILPIFFVYTEVAQIVFTLQFPDQNLHEYLTFLMRPTYTTHLTLYMIIVIITCGV
jgi:hypothetical protein